MNRAGKNKLRIADRVPVKVVLFICFVCIVHLAIQTKIRQIATPNAYEALQFKK